MSLRRNIFANYSSQIYITGVGIITVPMYIRYMGVEAYGLVGFFAMIQVWFNLLDMGLSATVARESSRFNGGAISSLEYRHLVRALEWVFIFVALVGGGVLFTQAKFIAIEWLNANKLPVSELIYALQIIAIIVAMRWMCGMYRGVISGAERFGLLSVFNIIISTIRYVLVLPVLILLNGSPTTFFNYQLGVALLELTGLALIAYRFLPSIPGGQSIRWQWASLKPVLKFSMSVAFTTSIWVVITQTDKLILAKILPLADYGYFSVAIMVASGIMMLAGPINNSIIPRMTRLNSENEQEELVCIYRKTTQLVLIITLPVVLVLTFFSNKVLWLWTGNVILADKAGMPLSLYAIGYGFLVLGAFPYYLQYAKGDLKLHIIGNFIFALLFIPSLIWATIHYGMTGAGWSWLISNAGYFFFWTPLIHRKMAPKIHWKWLFQDILKIAVIPILSAALISNRLPIENSAPEAFIYLILTGLALFLIGLLMSDKIKISEKIIK